MWKSGPRWLMWMRALASPQPESPSRARGSPGPQGTSPLLSQLSAPPPRPPRGPRPRQPALDLTLRESQEAVENQKPLGRVAELETLGLEVPPSARPLLELRQRLRLSGARVCCRRQRGLLRLMWLRILSLSTGAQDGDLDVRG